MYGPTTICCGQPRTRPAVVVGARTFELPSADLVTNDDAAGARMAVEHLISLGHRDITFLTAPTGSAALRANSYQETMTRHGLQENIRVVRTDLSEHSGFEAMNSLIESGRPPTAVLAANDVLAVGALSAADEHGISVPSQLSLIGYDNTYLAGIRHLSLTSVDPVSRDVGIRAAQLLLERMARPSLPQRTEVLPPELVIRSSTAAAPKG